MDVCALPIKSKLKSFLITDSTTIDDEQMPVLCYGVVTGKETKLEYIFEMYDNLLQFLQINTVVFDSYSLPTKMLHIKSVPEKQVQLSK